ncbi:MAG: hypothetical protein AzoDbin1_02719 [Azoarcus sp.]|nr:hypothetical protein [Azoarcus sp.]
MNDIAAADAAPPSDKRVACFGRFMIDVPSGADVGYADAEYRFGVVHTKRIALDGSNFAAAMEEREARYRNVDENRDRALKQTLSPSPESRIIVTSERIFGDDDYGFEAYRVDHGVLFSIEQKNYESAVMRAKVLPFLNEKLLPSLRARAPDEIPTDPGLCIRDGFIASDGSEGAYERTNIGLHFKRWPDLAFSVTTSIERKAEPTLLERRKNRAVPDIFKPLLFQIKTLREGRHDVGGLAADESLVMMPTDHGYKVHMFRWESHPELNDPFKPSIVVELDTGRSPNGDQQPTISEKEAVELFDAVVNSIRLRPTGPARTSEAPSPRTPLGAFVRSGEACTQTGWWQCPDGGELEGGNRRFLLAGEAMPPAVTLGAPSLLQRLSGERPRHEAPTVWKLVAYAEEQPPTPDPVSDVSAPREGSTGA